MGITKKGYNRLWINGRQIMEHVLVWETHHGRKVPPGHDVHHIDHDKLNNDPANLLLVTKLEHKRIHSGCELREGVWWKPCGRCLELKPVTAEHWYLRKQGWPNNGMCRPCSIAEVVVRKRARKARRAAALAEGASS